MSEFVQIGEALEGYGVLVQQLLGDWTPFLNGVSAKVGTGKYGAADAEADFSAVAKLVLDSLFLVGSEASDALAILTSTFAEQVSSGEYSTDPKYAGTERKLTLKGDLVSVSGVLLPMATVTPVPDKLMPKSIRFGLSVLGDGMKARTYDGIVLSTDAAGVAEEIPVTVMVG